VYPELVESIEHQAYGCHGKKSGKTIEFSGRRKKYSMTDMTAEVQKI
jgi:hypothetical protein